METTGSFTDWTGNMLDIGPIYPFVGSETLLVILLLIFWVGWHIIQISIESRNMADQARRLREGSELERAVQFEHSPERM